MALLVLKFGGSSVADRACLFRVARLVAAEHACGHSVAVVVSAQGDTTDHLLAAAHDVSPRPALRELDMLLATGEQASAALLCMALGQLEVPAVSLTGWQAGVHTDGVHAAARIRQLDVRRVRAELEAGRVAVVTGFQGLAKGEEITTLGRGGSDTSAVALAAALKADSCRIYTDVEGVYTADPRRVPAAHPLRSISCSEMLELASAGAGVLHPRSVRLAARCGICLQVLSSLAPSPGTTVKEVSEMEDVRLKSVTADADICLLTVTLTRADPLAFTAALAAGHIPVQQAAQQGDALQLLLSAEAARAAAALLEKKAAALGVRSWHADADSACLSLVGGGVAEEPAVLLQLLQTLADTGISHRVFSVSALRISVLVPQILADAALRAVHASFFEQDTPAS